MPIFELSAIIGIIIAILVIAWIIWAIFRGKGDRIGTEQHEIEEDKELLKTDKNIRGAAEDERRQSDTLWNLINLLSSRLSQIGFNDSGDRSNQYQFILQGLQVIRSEGKSVFEDKKIVGEINSAINAYLNGLPNDAAINELVRKIRDAQNKLFKDILKQDLSLRREFTLLRKKANEIVSEEGSFEKAA